MNPALHSCETITSPFGPPQGLIIGNDVKPLIIIENGEILLAFSAVSRMLSARVFKLNPPQIWGEVLLIFFSTNIGICPRLNWNNSPLDLKSTDKVEGKNKKIS